MRANTSIFRTVLLATSVLVSGAVAVAVSAPSGLPEENIRVAGDHTPNDEQLSALRAEPPASSSTDVALSADVPPQDPRIQQPASVESRPSASPTAAVSSDSDSDSDPASDVAEADSSGQDGSVVSDPTPQATDQGQPPSLDAEGSATTPEADDDQIESAGGEDVADEQTADASGSESAGDEASAGGNVRVVDNDDGCTSSFCPNGIGLEPTDISDTTATFIFFPIPDAEPTFTLQQYPPSDTGPIPQLQATEGALEISGMAKGTQYILRADRDFGFAAGSASETIYFQTLSPAIDRYCDQIQVSFENDLIMQTGRRMFSSITPVDFDPACGEYDVWLHSADYNHTEGYQPYQTGEQWRIEGMNLAGEILYRSPSTPDLPENQKVAYYKVDTMYGPDITEVQAFHTGEGNINSVHAAASFLPVVPNPRTPNLCGTIDVLFINPGLVNGADLVDRTTVGMEIDAAGRQYQLWLYSRDLDHAIGESGGSAEQWFVEGLDAEGNVVYTSPVAPDLPDDQVLSQALVGVVTLDEIVSFRGHHLGREGENSIEASMVLVPVDVALPDEPYPLWCKHLNVQRP